MANLLRQVGHALIERCRIFLDSRSIFTWEFEEAIEKTTAARAVFGHFKQFYNEERNNIQGLVQRLTDNGRCKIPLSLEEVKKVWDAFPIQIIFRKTTVFERRMVIIVKIFQLIHEFSRLSRVELSAMGGRSLTAQVHSICIQVYIIQMLNMRERLKLFFS